MQEEFQKEHLIKDKTELDREIELIKNKIICEYHAAIKFKSDTPEGALTVNQDTRA